MQFNGPGGGPPMLTSAGCLSLGARAHKSVEFYYRGSRLHDGSAERCHTAATARHAYGTEQRRLLACYYLSLLAAFETAYRNTVFNVEYNSQFSLHYSVTFLARLLLRNTYYCSMPACHQQPCPMDQTARDRRQRPMPTR